MTRHGGMAAILGALLVVAVPVMALAGPKKITGPGTYGAGDYIGPCEDIHDVCGDYEGAVCHWKMAKTSFVIGGAVLEVTPPECEPVRLERPGKWDVFVYRLETRGVVTNRFGTKEFRNREEKPSQERFQITVVDSSPHPGRESCGEIVEGKATLRGPGGKTRPAEVGMPVYYGETISVSDRAEDRLAIVLENGSTLRLYPGASLTCDEVREEERRIGYRIKHLAGRIWADFLSILDEDKGYDITGRNHKIGIRGTTITVERRASVTHVRVLASERRDALELRNICGPIQDTVIVPPGYESTADGCAPPETPKKIVLPKNPWWEDRR